MPAGTTVGDFTFPPWCTLVAEALAFLAFTDCFIYWIHRGLHRSPLPSSKWLPIHVSSLLSSYSSHVIDVANCFTQKSTSLITCGSFPPPSPRTPFTPATASRRACRTNFIFARALQCFPLIAGCIRYHIFAYLLPCNKVRFTPNFS
jgi:hypothetical protein